MSGPQQAVDRILDRGGSDAEVLQGVVDVLHDRIDVIPVTLSGRRPSGTRREFPERISVQISRAAAGAAAVL